MKKALITFVACAVIIALGVVLGSRGGKSDSGSGTAQAEPKTEERLLNVGIQVLEARDVEDFLYLTGTIYPWEEVVVSSEVRGKIEGQEFEEGDQIEAGVEVLRINTKTILANKDQAVAEHRSALQELNRVQRLREEGISSPQDLDKAIVARDTSRARLRLTEIQLEQSVITSPIAGVLDRVEKEQGEFVDVGAPLLRIVQVDKVKMMVGLPEREVASFKVGDEVLMAPDAFPERIFRGTVYRIATSAEMATRTFITEIEFDNAEELLRPGMIARARLIKKEYSDAITAPLFSILNRGDERFVFVEKDGVAHERNVQLGFIQEGEVHISEGLDAGENLIIAGHRDLRDGQGVQVHLNEGSRE